VCGDVPAPSFIGIRALAVKKAERKYQHRGDIKYLQRKEGHEIDGYSAYGVLARSCIYILLRAKQYSKYEQQAL
jgi:hypothetical protein